MGKNISQEKNPLINVSFNGKNISIDVFKELLVNPSIINEQLKNSPSSYAFLCLIRNKYIKKRDLLESLKEKAYSEAYIFYKESHIGGMTNELASNKANVTNRVQSLTKKFIIASNKADNLIALCKAYEGRERILQTLSANLRKEI